LGVDSDVNDLEAKHCADSLCGHLFDLVKLAGIYQSFVYHPASAACDDLVKCQILVYVLCVDTAGRHEFHIYIRSSHSFDHSQSACSLSREELNNIQAQRNSSLDIARVAGTRSHRDVLVYTIFYNFRIQTRAYDELSACIHCTVNLLCGQNSTCSNQHVREFLGHDADGFLSSSGTERNLCTRKSSFAKSFCQRLSVFRLVQNYDWYNTN